MAHIPSETRAASRNPRSDGFDVALALDILRNGALAPEVTLERWLDRLEQARGRE